MNRRLADEKQQQQQQLLSGSSVSMNDVLIADVHKEIASVTHSA